MADWQKTARIYCLEVGSFYDSDGDGVGDFAGLERKLDYIADLGFNTLWLLPCYPSPRRDYGYDITDYLNVDQRLGTLADLERVVRRARDEHGLRVLLELVAHHTSDEHPWFRAAAADSRSRYRDFYFWREKPPQDPFWETAFPGPENGVWHYSRQAGQYYFHRFYHFMPDLNIFNPRVQEEILRIVDFWLSFGVCGFRIDAATHMFERRDGDDVDEQFAADFLQRLHDFVRVRNPEGVLLGEADVPAEEVGLYLGEGRRMTMLFNFLMNNEYWLGLARLDSRAIREGKRGLPRPPAEAQWVNFLRNHDELNLGQLEEAEQQEVFEAFAPDPDWRIYERGIRRRLAPLLGGDPQRLRAAYSLLYGTAGVPAVLYGDEIGMGDNLDLPERMALRTPMQWSGEEHGSFTTAREGSAEQPPIEQGEYSFRRVNVADQIGDGESLLSFVQELNRLRSENDGLASHADVLHAPDKVTALGHTAGEDGYYIICLTNISGEPQRFRLSRPYRGAEVLLSDGKSLPGPPIELSSWGFLWLRVGGKK